MAEQGYEEKLDAGFEVIDQESKQNQPPVFSEIELSTGVRIKPLPVSPYLMQAILKQFPLPEVPVFYNEQKNREEENPGDPDYIKRVQDVEVQRSTAILDSMLGLGTEILYVPDRLLDFEAAEWKDSAKEFGLVVPKTLAGKKVLWLKIVAAPKASDVERIIGGIAALSGVTEKAVAEALPNFRS